MSGLAAVHDSLVAAGIRLFAGVPDDWVADLFGALSRDRRVRLVPTARESEAVAICSGAFFGGTPAAALMSAPGLFNCLGELAQLNVRYQVPVLILATLRGVREDARAYSEVHGRLLRPALDACGYLHEVLEDPGQLADSYRWSRIQKRPLVVFLPHSVCRGGS